MNHVQTVSAFIQQPHEESIRLVRRLLVRRGLRLVSEIDLGKRLEEELGIDWRYASTLLVVDDPASLYEAFVQDSIAALDVVHFVAVTGDDSGTRIAANIAAAPARPRESSMAKSIGRHVGTRIAEVIRSIAEHHDAILIIRDPQPSAEPLSADQSERDELYEAVRG